MKNTAIFLIFASVLFLTASSADAKSLTADLRGTSADSAVTGEVQFHETPKGLKVLAHIEGAAAGKHGIHIHEKGDCGDSGNAAGGHFNPEGLPHGEASKDGIAHVHAGDLGNIEIGPDGKGDLEITIPGLTVEPGKFSVSGRSVILHEKEDDYGQPTGNAGGRIGCAEIPSAV